MGESHSILELLDKLGNILETSPEQEEWKRRSIYRIHPSITSWNEQAFKPKLVSFGPYHHREEHLKLMEEHKERALRRFLKRSRKTIQDFLYSLSEVVDELKNSHDPLGPEWIEDTDTFLKLIVLDGCFMLEILCVAADILVDHTESDPIFSKHWQLSFLPLVQRDMLMIENQLPLLVLDTMLAFEGGKAKDEESAKKLIVKVLCPWATRSSRLGKCLHVLDLYRKSLLLEEPSIEPYYKQIPYPGRDISDDDIIDSATFLVEAGIMLGKSKTSSLRDITFERGVLNLPTITVDETTQWKLLNIMAFERFHKEAGKEVTSYVRLMNYLIHTRHDVALLISKGIIRNAYGSKKAVAELFNSLSHDVIHDQEGYLDFICWRINAYCKTPWHTWRASLIHTYFYNPWVMLSLIAAVFLFGASIMQTIYTVHPYYSPRDK